MSTWVCSRCRTINQRTSSPKCGACGYKTKPKRRVPKHRETLRDQGYQEYEALSLEIHGGELGHCGMCGAPPPDGEQRIQHHHRDHDHQTGRARGLACFRCNMVLLRKLTLEEARAIVAYHERVEAFYRREAA